MPGQKKSAIAASQQPPHKTMRKSKKTVRPEMEIEDHIGLQSGKEAGIPSHVNNEEQQLMMREEEEESEEDEDSEVPLQDDSEDSEDDSKSEEEPLPVQFVPQKRKQVKQPARPKSKSLS